jgi:hypothetical protein
VVLDRTQLTPLGNRSLITTVEVNPAFVTVMA